jgi:colanic acid/amylovoran biosynthesis glycosyltransferase
LSNKKLNYDGPNVQVVKILRQLNHLVFISGTVEIELFRLIQMILDIIKAKLNSCNLIFIDVFSTKAFYYAYFSAIVAKTLNLPYVLILHGGDLPKRYSNNPNLSFLLLKNALRIISPSEYLAVQTFNSFSLKVIIIPNKLDVILNTDDIKDMYKIFWVRSISPIYNPEMAIDVLHELVKMDKRFHLTMIGPGSKDNLKSLNLKILNSKLQNNICLKGKMSRQDWHFESKNVGIFINTSNIDNTPSSVLEAFFLNMVIVSTNVGGMPYLIKHNYNGILVPIGDAKIMANEIFKLSKDFGKCNHLRSNALLEVNKKYTSEVILNKWKNLLVSLNIY